MKCQNCGTESKIPNAKFCIKCGCRFQSEHVTTYAAPTTEKKPVKGAVLTRVIAICLAGTALLLLSALCAILLLKDPAPPALPAPTTIATTAETAPSAMISYVGWTYSDAVAHLAPVGCEINHEYVFDDTHPAETIIMQTLPEGMPLNEYSVILFTVSKGADVCPYEYSQKVTVTAPAGSRSAQLVLYEWDNGGWVSKFACSATVGRNGIGSNYGEGKGYTPAGLFKLGVALSQDPIGNAAWPIRYVTYDTCVVDDVDSRYYNTIQSVSSLPYGVDYDPVGETLISGSTDVFLYIEHNGNGLTSDGVIPGKGSVITLCGKRSGYSAHTGGCIDLTQQDMHELIFLLDHSQNPHIEIIAQ